MPPEMISSKWPWSAVGGRGTGAANNALGTKAGPIQLVAMADVFEKKLNDIMTT